MEGILKVTPEKLIQSSGTFATTGTQVKNLTGEMMTLVDSLQWIWQGEASGTFLTRFKTLQTDMDKLYRMIAEHSQDLTEMAGHYQRAESGNMEQGSGLESNIIN